MMWSNDFGNLCFITISVVHIGWGQGAIDYRQCCTLEGGGLERWSCADNLIGHPSNILILQNVHWY
jgi:hypothetical protein